MSSGGGSCKCPACDSACEGSWRWSASSALRRCSLRLRRRRERLGAGIALARAEMPYRNAKLMHDRLAEAAVNEYAEGIFRRELAAVDNEVERAEDQLNVATNAPPDWAERIRAKGYLLLVKGSALTRELNVKKAAVYVEQARSKRHVPDGLHQLVKILEELNDRVAKARGRRSRPGRRPTNGPRRRGLASSRRRSWDANSRAFRA